MVVGNHETILGDEKAVNIEEYKNVNFIKLHEHNELMNDPDVNKAVELLNEYFKEEYPLSYYGTP